MIRKKEGMHMDERIYMEAVTAFATAFWSN